jgi:hypothetical protein
MGDSAGISRRDMLKRGAALGGAVVWATPVVQVIGMSPALATTASPVPCTTFVSYRAKAEWNGSEYVWESNPGVGRNDCDDCGGAEGVDGSAFLNITGDDEVATVTVISSDCSLTGMVVAKAGRDGCFDGSGDSTSMTVTTDGKGISHVEVCFECCAD